MNERSKVKSKVTKKIPREVYTSCENFISASSIVFEIFKIQIAAVAAAAAAAAAEPAHET